MKRSKRSVASGSVSDRDQLFRAENPNCRVGETANFFAEFLLEFPLELSLEIFAEFSVEIRVEFHAVFLGCHGRFMEEIGLTGESSPIDRAGKRPYVPDPNMPARFAHDPLQSAGDRSECLLVRAQSGSRPLDFHVKASQGNFRHD